MIEPDPPSRCALCGSTDTITVGGFVQHYRQKGGTYLPVPWWRCHWCKGWFAHPVPNADAIRSNWATVIYADPRWETKIAANKRRIMQRVLDRLSQSGEVGDLLDVGCNFGTFMSLAQEGGWRTVGFDPNEDALRIASRRGLEVHRGWTADQCGFPAGRFRAITSLDVFCYSWNPYADLQAYSRLLADGGTLVMRVTNKRFFLGMVRAVVSPGPARDARLSRILQGQFHSISIASLTRIMRGLNFEDICCEPRASTAPFRSLTWTSRAAYLTSDVVRLASFGQVDLSPGVLVFARKRGGETAAQDARPVARAA